MEGMAKSAETVYKLIKGEMRAGIPSERIMVGGFSQGQCQGKFKGFCWNLRGIFTTYLTTVSGAIYAPSK